MATQKSYKEFLLKSFDSREMLAGERTCSVLGNTEFETGKSAVWCELAPAIILQDALGWGPDQRKVLITARFEGDDIREIHGFPFFVHVAIPESDLLVGSKSVSSKDFSMQLNAELYSVENSN